MNRILVIGLGQLGMPVAKYAKQKGFDVYGYDLSIKAMERAKEIAEIKISTSFKDFDVYIICVSTHKTEDIFSPQTDGLLSIAKKLSYEAPNGALVSIESTIPTGTSRKIFELVNHRLHVVHAPHRWYSLDEEKYGVNQLRVIGGVSNCCLEIGTRFYNGLISESIEHAGMDENYIKSLEIPMHQVSKIELAELTKIVENSHRFLQIAFAEDLYMYCQSNEIQFSELREALNTKWNVEILEPREGIGGHCLPKDTKMFLQSSKTIQSKILQAAMKVDNEYKQKRTIKLVNNA